MQAQLGFGDWQGALCHRVPWTGCPTAHLGLGDWTWEPTVVVGLIALCALYVVALRRGWIRSDDDTASWFADPRWRPVVFALGVLAAVVALLSPIDRGGDAYLFSIHMLQHLLLMMVAAPLVLLGIVGARSPAPGRVPRLRALWAGMTRPWPATLLFNLVVVVWHLPQLYDTTLTNEPVHVVEHLTFIGAGVVFWWPIVDPARGGSGRPVSAMQKIAMLGLSGVLPTVLGFVFAMDGAAIYDYYATVPRLWGWSVTVDQQIAGVLMLGLGNLIYFAAISVIFLRMFGSPEQDEAASEAAAQQARAGARI